MTVFKTYLKILNKNKWIVLMYTAILLFFGVFNFQSSDNGLNFTESKPDVFIINEDEESKLSQNLVSYLERYTNQKEINDDIESMDDALFYRDVNYIIYIPKNYQEDFLSYKNPTINIKSTKDYQASLAEILLNKYLKVANLYNTIDNDVEELITDINENLEQDIHVEMTSSLDNDSLSKVAFFYNFSNYSMLAGCIYVICLILTTFKQETIQKRTSISSTNYKKINRELFLANSIFAFTLAVLYILLSYILIGKTMFTIHGLLFITNFFAFTICAVSIAFLLGNLIKKKEVINGVINVIALGSSFLCGAFVPVSMLPDEVLKIAHILPSYYFIHNNEVIKNLEHLTCENLMPIGLNISIVLLFTILFGIISNIVSKRHQKI